MKHDFMLVTKTGGGEQLYLWCQDCDLERPVELSEARDGERIAEISLEHIFGEDQENWTQRERTDARL